MPNSWTDRQKQYAEVALKVCNVNRLSTKDGRLWRVVGWSLQIASFGRFTQQRFLEEFASTLGPIQAYPRHWCELPMELIVHEARHTQQFLFAGWFVPILGWCGRRCRVWAGLLPMAFVYGLFPLPIFFAWGRFQLELDADCYAWKMALEKGWMSADDVRKRAKHRGELVSSWAYLKSWPRRWSTETYRKRAEALIANH